MLNRIESATPAGVYGSPGAKTTVATGHAAGSSDSALAPVERQSQPDGILQNLPQPAPRSHGTAPHQSWTVGTNIDSSADALADLFAHFQKTDPTRPVAVISGGSLSGCSTALELARQGYQVVMAEKRLSYSRQNVLSLKTDTLLYWATLSPDGALLRTMVQNRAITPCHREIVPATYSATGYVAVANPAVRFLNWLLPPASLPPRIPVRERHADLQVRQQDLAGLADAVPRQPNTPLVEALDLAWPANEPVTAVPPQEWKAPPAEFFSSDNMVFGQLRCLEHSLNQYCLQQPSIHVVRAAIELQQEADAEGNFAPVFVLDNAGTTERFTPREPVTVICLAEGAQSPNRKRVGGEVPAVETNESWRQGNYVGARSNVGGFNIVDVRPDTIIATQHIEQSHQSLVNISVFHPTDQPPAEKTVTHQLHQAQAHVDTAAAQVAINENNRIYDSGQIDIRLRMARNPMQKNVIQIGDTAFSGSPAGGYGGSAGASQFSILARDTVNHPLFQSTDPEDRRQVEDFYRRRVADIHEVRTGRPTAALRQLGVYSPETVSAHIRQASGARFEGLTEIDIPPKGAEEQR